MRLFGHGVLNGWELEHLWLSTVLLGVFIILCGIYSFSTASFVSTGVSKAVSFLTESETVFSFGSRQILSLVYFYTKNNG